MADLASNGKRSTLNSASRKRAAILYPSESIPLCTVEIKDLPVGLSEERSDEGTSSDASFHRHTPFFSAPYSLPPFSPPCFGSFGLVPGTIMKLSN